MCTELFDGELKMVSFLQFFLVFIGYCTVRSSSASSKCRH
jgi:hypothetical protein